MRLFYIYSLLLLCLTGNTQQISDLDLPEVYKPLSWEEEKEITFAIAALAGVTYLASATNDQSVINDQSIIDLLDPKDVNSFDRSAIDNWSIESQTASDYFQYGVIAIPALLGIDKRYRKDIKKHVVYAIQTVAISSGVTHTIKNTLRRARPFTYNTDLPYGRRLRNRNNQSFPSGHTSFVASLSFFGAKTWTDLHPEYSSGKKVSIWALATGITATTGYLRVKGGKHFSTDVIVGGLLGAATGYLVPHIHKQEYSSSVSIDAGPGGMKLTYVF